MAIKTYKDLEVWQLAMSLAEDVYVASRTFPSDEKFALRDQLRRAAVSIPSNIAEGFGRDTTKDFLHFLFMARGSLFEVTTQLELARRLKYLSDTTNLNEKAERVGMMINALATRLKERLSARATNREPRTTSHEPRTTNHEPRTTNRESLITNH